MKFKLQHEQEFVIGGFRGNGADGVDALIVGYYEHKKLRMAAKIRAGMVPHVRRELFKKLASFHALQCPFVNLPDAKRSRWGGGVTAEEMKVRGTRTCRSHRFPTRSFCRLRRQTALRGRRFERNFERTQRARHLHVHASLRWHA